MAQRSEARDIERIPVDSSNLHAIGYSYEKQVLAIEFKSGDVFHYRGVTPELFEQLGSAPSRGRFYSLNVRGKFQSDKMTGLCTKCGGHGYIGERCEDCGTGDVLAVDTRYRKLDDERPVNGSWADAAAAIEPDVEEVDPREAPTGEGRY